MASTKKSFITFFILIMAVTVNIKAQPKNTFDPKGLKLTITEVDNNYQNKGQALIKLAITNNAKQALPATGWHIFFNSKNALQTIDKEALFTIQQLTGNLFQLTPAQAFKPLAPNETFSARVILDALLINKNDQPEGFYLVWDDAPTKAINIKNLVTTPFPIQPINGSIISDFATETYNRYAALEKIPAEDVQKIFPTPASFKNSSKANVPLTGVGNAADKPFLLSSTVQISADAAFKNEANILSDDLFTLLGKKINVASSPIANNSINLIKKDGLPAEGYELTVTADGVTIAASTPAGIFYGIQSLKSLLPAEAWKTSNVKKPIAIQSMVVIDSPRFGYRGFLLDVARNFQTKKEVFRVLDLMGFYKLNTFHFHLTEDEGWRVEIDGLPELTEIGARRGHSLDEKENMPAAYGSGGLTDSLYGSGYYTKADFIEILQYANARHIKVIPEIETPGHARAAIKSMDARYARLMKAGKKEEALQYFLRDTADQSTYTTAQSFHDNVMDVALPSVYTFLEKVVSEVVKLYQQAGAPLTTIHLGGDEVPAGVWERSPDCANLIKKEPSIKNTDGLWYYYLGKVNNILKAKGLTLSGWEEISFRRTMIDGKKVNIPNPGFANQDMKLYVWNNLEGSEDLAYKLANNGYKVIITFVTNFYLDMAQHKTYDEPGYYWGGFTDLEKVYRFIPYDYLKNAIGADGKLVALSTYSGKQRLTDYGKENIAGLQGSLWGETLKGPQQMEYMLLPRLTAIAEKAWAGENDWAIETDTAKSSALYSKGWSQYNAVLGLRELPRLDYLNGGYNYRIPFAGAMVKDGQVYANVPFANFTIRYTTNGEEPTNKSALYTMPIAQKGIIKLKVFNGVGRGGNVTVVENK